jgi:hypothetical protein
VFITAIQLAKRMPGTNHPTCRGCTAVLCSNRTPVARLTPPQSPLSKLGDPTWPPNGSLEKALTWVGGGFRLARTKRVNRRWDCMFVIILVSAL